MSLILITFTVVYVFFIVFILSGLFRHNNLSISSSSDLPSVTVVVAARNEEEVILNLIHDLVNQEYPIDKLEVIIVDDRSTDSTKEILKEAIENYSCINVITIKEKSTEIAPKKNALSKGIDKASGQIILLTDADCRLGKLWVSSMAYSVMNKDCISIGFSEISIEHGSIFERYQKLDFFSIIAANAGACGWNQYWSGTGQNLAFYKSDFISIGQFENVKKRISGDDMYLVQSISKLKKGYLHIDPNSFVKTYAMKSIKDYINQRIRWSSNSKNNYHDSPSFFAFLFIMLCYNSIILFSFIFSKPWLLLFIIKFILEGLVLYLGNKLFNKKMDFAVYFLWSILQPIYIPFIGLMGIRGKFSWKP